MKELKKHKKLFGIKPDLNSRQYLEMKLRKLEMKNEKFRRKNTQLEIGRLRKKLEMLANRDGHDHVYEIKKMLEYTDLKTANIDLGRGFEVSIGKIKTS